MMAEQMLGSANVYACSIPARRIDEILAEINAEKPDMVLLCALPPFGLARAHRIYRNVRARYPKVRIVIGIWSYPDDSAEAAKKISGSDDARMWTRLTEALAEIRSLAGQDPLTEPAAEELGRPAA
jgi:hypothetical protein